MGWSNLRQVEDPENIYKYILWNNKERLTVKASSIKTILISILTHC